MGIIKAFADSVSGSFADQWKEIITAGNFDELTAIAPGLLKVKDNVGRGSNVKRSDGVITSGSIIYVPENTAAYIFSQAGIENVIDKAGGYEYQDGEKSFFNGDSLIGSIVNQTGSRIGFGGISNQEKKIVFVNLRELRGILFGTQGAQLYHDKFYDADLEIVSHGSFSIIVTDTEKFIKNFVPVNTTYYSFEDVETKKQIVSELVLSLIVALNSLSVDYRISQLLGNTKLVCQKMIEDNTGVGTWEERFGFKVVSIAIENVELTNASKELIKNYNSNKMNVKAYEDVSQKTSNIAAQQKIAEGIKDKGLGDGGAGVILGMNVAQNIGANGEFKSVGNIDRQIETVKKLKELLDSGVLTKEEFDKKKKEIMEL